MNKWSKINIKDLFLKIFLPESCINCGESGKTICNECLLNVKSHRVKNKNIENIDWIRASLDYKNPKLRSALFFLKYHHTKSVANYLANAIYEDVLSLIYEIVDETHTNMSSIALIAVPISKKRLIERDYNQSELILKAIIKNIKEKENINLENNIYTNLITKDKHTIKFSHTHTPQERERLIKDVFRVNEKDYSPTFFSDKAILIIDDITTTGSTFYEIRDTLVKSGAKRENIFGYAIAH